VLPSAGDQHRGLSRRKVNQLAVRIAVNGPRHRHGRQVRVITCLPRCSVCFCVRPLPAVLEPRQTKPSRARGAWVCAQYRFHLEVCSLTTRAAVPGVARRVLRECHKRFRNSLPKASGKQWDGIASARAAHHRFLMIAVRRANRPDSAQGERNGQRRLLWSRFMRCSKRRFHFTRETTSSDSGAFVVGAWTRRRDPLFFSKCYLEIQFQ